MNAFSLFTLGSDMVAQVLFVVVPLDVNREAYIQTFYQTGLLAVTGEGGEFFTRVTVPKHLMADIRFAQSKNEKGSAVLIVTPEKYPTAKFVLAVLPYNNTLDGVIDENCMYNRVDSGANVIELFGDANNAFFQINVNSQNSENGSFAIRLKTPQQSILIEGDNNGVLSFTGSDSVKHYAKNRVVQSIVDSDNATVSEFYLAQNEIVAKKTDADGKVLASFTINDSEAVAQINEIIIKATDSQVAVGKQGVAMEKAVLGESQLKILKSLCDALSQIKTDPVTGVILPDSVLLFQQVKGSLETTLANFTVLN